MGFTGNFTIFHVKNIPCTCHSLRVIRIKMRFFILQSQLLTNHVLGVSSSTFCFSYRANAFIIWAKLGERSHF